MFCFLRLEAIHVGVHRFIKRRILGMKIDPPIPTAPSAASKTAPLEISNASRMAGDTWSVTWSAILSMAVLINSNPKTPSTQNVSSNASVCVTSSHQLKAITNNVAMKWTVKHFSDRKARKIPRKASAKVRAQFRSWCSNKVKLHNVCK